MNAEAARLKALFARRDLAARQLAEVDRRLDAAALAYGKSRGFLIRPRLETLRREVGA